MTNCKCGARLKTREQLRRGWCTPECQRGHTSTSPTHSVELTLHDTSTSGVDIRYSPRVNRKHGIDYRGRDE